MIFDSVPTVFVQDNAVGLIFSYIRLCIDQCLLGQQSSIGLSACEFTDYEKQDKSDFDRRERRKKPNIHFELANQRVKYHLLSNHGPPLFPKSLT